MQYGRKCNFRVILSSRSEATQRPRRGRAEPLFGPFFVKRKSQEDSSQARLHPHHRHRTQRAGVVRPAELQIIAIKRCIKCKITQLKRHFSVKYRVLMHSFCIFAAEKHKTAQKNTVQR